MENNPFVKQDFQESQERKAERYQELSDKASKRSDELCDTAHKEGQWIPLGEPIKIGHHSERRHRRHIERLNNLTRKSIEEEQKAGHYADKAASVGTGGISSIDPEAIAKLKSELEDLEYNQRIMKEVNRVLRSKKIEDKAAHLVVHLSISEEKAKKLIEPDFCGRVGFTYQLSNNNANIRRIKKRIADLEAMHNSKPIEERNDDFDLYIDDGYVVIDFHAGKPSEEVRTLVKRHAFKWSRYRSAWVRKVTPNALADVEYSVIGRLKDLF